MPASMDLFHLLAGKLCEGIRISVRRIVFEQISVFGRGSLA